MLKNSKVKVLAAAAVLILAAGLLAAVLYKDSEEPAIKASLIAPGSNIEDVRRLSAGDKDVCLTDNQAAIEAVKKDDSFVDENEEYSKFDMAASLGIIDIPAGTNYDVTVQRYDGTLAQGALHYEGDYGTYNYTIEKVAEQGEWRLVSIIACQS